MYVLNFLNPNWLDFWILRLMWLAVKLLEFEIKPLKWTELNYFYVVILFWLYFSHLNSYQKPMTTISWPWEWFWKPITHNYKKIISNQSEVNFVKIRLISNEQYLWSNVNYPGLRINNIKYYKKILS